VSRNSILIHATPDAVFDVLDDAYAYPRWVVGTRRIRYVDPEWPTEGSRFHHAIGTFVAEIHDSTRVVSRDRPHAVELEVRFRPTGVARVRISTISDQRGTRVTLEEVPTAGPISSLPRAVADFALSIRNAISLRRFKHLCEARSPKTVAS
jgi:Polyketide cyclase / dehydrase and lipid transport